MNSSYKFSRLSYIRSGVTHNIITRQNQVMMKIYLALLTLFLTAMVPPANKTITGKVTSFEESFPIKGVVVRVKGTNVSTQTIDNGTFSLSIPDEGQSLTFTLAGYQSKEVPITKKAQYNVVLERESR